MASPSCAGVDVSVGMPLRWDPFGRDGVRRQEVKGDWCALREFTEGGFFRSKSADGLHVLTGMFCECVYSDLMTRSLESNE